MLPDRLRIKGREPQSFDDPNEQLFRRVKPRFWPHDGWPPKLNDALAHVIDIPECSVVRSQFCESPEDARINAQEFGVVAWRYIQLSPHLSNENGEVQITVVHTPDLLTDFYPHSDIRFAVGCCGSQKAFRLFVRREIAKLASIILPPKPEDVSEAQ